MEHTLLLNRYRFLQQRGRGGFGTVDVAWDQRLRRRVAIKRIPLRVDADDLPGIEEARTAAMLSDTHIVSVYDFEVTGTEALIIMENVDGPTLGELMQKSADLFDLDCVCALLAGIAQALECAHENQVLHLDIKPSNVLIDHAGHVKMSDFGLAALSSTAGFSEAQGGTIGYMPPEQIEAQPVDERSDLWAFASLAYQLLTGANPFFAESPSASLAQILNTPFVLPSAIRPELEQGIDEILVCALDADPEVRPESIKQFWKALARFLGREKAGRQKLKALVAGWDAGEHLLTTPDEATGATQDYDSSGFETNPDEDVDTECAYEAYESSPHNDQTRSGQRTARALDVVLRLLCGVACAWCTRIALSGLAPAGYELPFAVVLMVAAVLGLCACLAPVLGSALLILVVGAGMFAAGQPLVGLFCIGLGFAWWWFFGRKSRYASVCMILAPLAAGVGAVFMVPLLAGYLLKVKQAAVLMLVAGILVSFLSVLTLGSLGPNMLFFAPYLPQIGLELQAIAITGELWTPFVTVCTSPWLLGYWLSALSAAALLSLTAHRQSQVLCTLGIFIALAVLALGATAALLLHEAFAAPTDIAALFVSLMASGSIMLILTAKKAQDFLEEATQ
jgi:serine/threonine protein kinase